MENFIFGLSVSATVVSGIFYLDIRFNQAKFVTYLARKLF